jgi:hypothetical protein
MRKAIPFLAAVLFGLVLTNGAYAQQKKPAQKSAASVEKTTYKWVDEKGVTHYGDHVPAEYSHREQHVLNSYGVEVQKKQAEMTPAESAAHAAKQREEARRKQHDMFLISTYPSVKEIENVRDTRLTQVSAQISAAEAYIGSLTTRLNGLQQRAQLYAPYNTKPGARRMPDDLAEEMVRAMSELRTQNQLLASRRAEMQSVTEQFDNDITRFKELRTSAAARLTEANGIGIKKQ